MLDLCIIHNLFIINQTNLYCLLSGNSRHSYPHHHRTEHQMGKQKPRKSNKAANQLTVPFRHIEMRTHTDCLLVISPKVFRCSEKFGHPDCLPFLNRDPMHLTYSLILTLMGNGNGQSGGRDISIDPNLSHLLLGLMNIGVAR